MAKDCGRDVCAGAALLHEGLCCILSVISYVASQFPFQVQWSHLSTHSSPMLPIFIVNSKELDGWYIKKASEAS